MILNKHMLAIMDLKTRITAFCKSEKMSVLELTDKIKMSYGTVSKQIGGDRPVSMDTITAILAAFPDLSAEWLLRGDGDMYRMPEPHKKTDFIDIFLKGICSSSQQQLDEYQSALTSVRRLRHMEQDA